MSPLLLKDSEGYSEGEGVGVGDELVLLLLVLVFVFPEDELFEELEEELEVD